MRRGPVNTPPEIRSLDLWRLDKAIEKHVPDIAGVFPREIRAFRIINWMIDREWHHTTTARKTEKYNTYYCDFAFFGNADSYYDNSNMDYYRCIAECALAAIIWLENNPVVEQQDNEDDDSEDAS